MRIAYLPILALIAILAQTSFAHGQQVAPEQFQARLAKYQVQMDTGAKEAREEQARYCHAPRSFTVADCIRDYDELVAAIAKEQAFGVAYQQAIQANGFANANAQELKQQLKGAEVETTRLLALTRERYYHKSATIVGNQ